MMDSINHLPLFIVAGLLLNLTPGPDVVYIVTHGLRHGARAGVVAALGITAGCFVHIFAGALGVSALIAASATAFAVLKWLGAAYLVYVGATLLFSRHQNTMKWVANNDHSTGDKAIISLKKIFLQGFWTNALNPKVALFFLAFLPQFIVPGGTNSTSTGAGATWAFLLLGLVFNFNGLWVNMGWALLAAWIARRVTALQKAMGLLERVAGAMFIGFGLRLALSDNPSR